VVQHQSRPQTQAVAWMTLGRIAATVLRDRTHLGQCAKVQLARSRVGQLKPRLARRTVMERPIWPLTHTRQRLFDVSELIRERRVSPVELVTDCLERIDRLQLQTQRRHRGRGGLYAVGSEGGEKTSGKAGGKAACARDPRTPSPPTRHAKLTASVSGGGNGSRNATCEKRSSIDHRGRTGGPLHDCGVISMSRAKCQPR
jgi:hypothetical protein